MARIVFLATQERKKTVQKPAFDFSTHQARFKLTEKLPENGADIPNIRT